MAMFCRGWAAAAVVTFGLGAMPATAAEPESDNLRLDGFKDALAVMQYQPEHEDDDLMKVAYTGYGGYRGYHGGYGGYRGYYGGYRGYYGGYRGYYGGYRGYVGYGYRNYYGGYYRPYAYGGFYRP